MEAEKKDRRMISLQIPASLDRQLRQLAQREERTLSGQIRHLIQEALEQEFAQQHERAAA